MEWKRLILRKSVRLTESFWGKQPSVLQKLQVEMHVVHVRGPGVCKRRQVLEGAAAEGTGKPFEKPAGPCWPELCSIHGGYECRLRDISMDVQSRQKL